VSKLGQAVGLAVTVLGMLVMLVFLALQIERASREITVTVERDRRGNVLHRYTRGGEAMWSVHTPDAKCGACEWVAEGR
jgi:hypothetical protein